jgi:branched-chain amino acid transport system substrate-binding protein
MGSKLRRALLLSMLLTLVALVAGCGGDDDEDGGTDEGGTAIRGVEIETCGEVHYGGDGDPEALIVSDLPMQGDAAVRSEQQVEAIRLVLEQNDWRAGETSVAFQACDDSIAETGLWDEDTCESNAEAYAADQRVVGVIGTYNSGCAAIEIPILNEAGVAMVSPGNTAVCLSEASALCTGGQPDSLYEAGKRNYARVVPNDAFQGAALAEFAGQQGIERPFVLYAADDETSTGQAESFRGAAEGLGLELAGFETWDPEADRYADLFAEVERSGADAVVLAGLTEQNGARLIEDKVDALGPNSRVPLIGFDGFAQQATIDEAGAAAEGLYASVPGSTPENLSSEGTDFVADLEGRLDGAPVEQFAPYAAEAAAVLVEAIAASGADRDAVIDAVFAVEGGGGILKPYDIERSGDPSVGPVTVLVAGPKFEFETEISPPARLVADARG